MPPFPAPPARVLVTGGCGFLGHHLVHRLVAEGHAVTVLDDLSTGRAEALPTGPVTLIKGSILDRAALHEAAQGCTAVFHLAAVVGMRLAVSDRERAFHLSDEGTRLVLESTGDLPAILFSSSAVYGLTGSSAVNEDNTTGEAGCLAYDGGQPGYALGKWVLERHGQAAVTTGRPVLIVRPFNAVGEGQTPTYGMVVPRFIEQALKNEPITIYDDGGQSRTFSEVRCFTDCLWRLVHCPQVWTPPLNVVNIGTGESTTIENLAQLVREITGSSSELAYQPYSSVFPGKEDVRARVPDTQRLLSLIGPVAWPKLADIVRDLAEQARRAYTTTASCS